MSIRLDMESMNHTIGITGGIGAGKSVVSRVLRCNGFKVYDCDSQAKNLMVSNPEVKEKLIEKLGKDIYQSDGRINKEKLAFLLFSDSGTREYVNLVVHSAVREDIEKCRKKERGYFFIEAAILATGGIAPMCNSIWVVEAPEPERIKRVEIRDNMDSTDIKRRIQSQQDELKLLSGFNTVVLENDGKHPLVIEILKLTDKLNQQQTYFIPC
ncbi:MAG: dephospho-CoA kinase [Muribaculaceae bacterium]|nr:dephospho-CoA kinase [Muribaculaceae bacterium]